MNYLDKRAMEAVEHHRRQRELNSKVFYRKNLVSLGAYTAAIVETMKTAARCMVSDRSGTR